MNFSNLFNMDNAFFRLINRMVDLIWLNILTLICCLPVITGGAAFTAMYYVLLRTVNNEDGYVTRNFFRAFKENFKNATKVWLVALALILFYLYDIRLLRAGVMVENATMEKVVRVTIYIMLTLLAMVLSYVFPLMARYENELKVTVKNAFLFACAYLPRTLCMLVIYLFPAALLFFSNWFILFWLALGITFPGYLCSELLVKIFKRTDEIQSNDSGVKNEENKNEENKYSDDEDQNDENTNGINQHDEDQNKSLDHIDTEDKKMGSEESDSSDLKKNANSQKNKNNKKNKKMNN